MKREKVTMKKVILCNVLFLLFYNVFGQRINIDSLVNNEYLTFKLNVDEERLISLEIENTTCDTLLVMTKTAIEQKYSHYHILGYEKCYKEGENKDSIYYQWGVLWDYYGYMNTTQYIR